MSDVDNLPSTWPAAFAFAVDRIPQIVIAIGTAYGVYMVQKIRAQTNGIQSRIETHLKSETAAKDAALTENRALRGEKDIEEQSRPTGVNS